jgi:ribulose-phosphate 3-epimerase
MAARPLPHDVQVAPSILSSDFARLGAQVQEVMEAGARVIHCDVMDGHFVPPITMGPLVVGALADQVHAAGGVLDVHLMIERPERQVTEFARAGADNITCHFEATPHVNYTVAHVKEAGCQAGVALTPSTPAPALAEIAPYLDLALCMSVNPGWGGQEFLPTSPAKLEELRGIVGEGPVIEVDGGVDEDTAAAVVRAGATLLVAGSAVFGSADPAQAYRALTAAATST